MMHTKDYFMIYLLLFFVAFFFWGGEGLFCYCFFVCVCGGFCLLLKNKLSSLSFLLLYLKCVILQIGFIKSA